MPNYPILESARKDGELQFNILASLLRRRSGQNVDVQITRRNPTAADDSSLGYAIGSNWVNYATGQQWAASSVTSGAAVWGDVTAVDQYVLDLVTTATTAYGVLKLRSAYAGNAFRVERSSDSATLDVGFTTKAINGTSYVVADFDAADAFVGSSTGTITIWYDQSGNGQDATPGSSTPVLNTNSVNGWRVISPAYIASTQKSFNIPNTVTHNRQSVSVVTAGYNPSPAQGSSCYWSLGTDATFTNNLIFRSTNTAQQGLIGNVFPNFTQVDAMPQCIVVTSGTSATNVLVNETSTAGTGMSSVTLTGGKIGFYSGYQVFQDYMAVITYGRELSSTERTNCRNWTYQTFRLTPQVLDRIVCLGDSITAGADADTNQPWSRQMRSKLSIPHRIYNMGASGQTMAFFDTNYTANTAPLKASAPVETHLIIAPGTNDINAGTSAAALYALATSLIGKAKATGFSSISIATILPRANTSLGSAAAFDAVRDPYNVSVRANAADADVIIDIGASDPMGLTANVSDATLYVSSLHPTARGARYLAPVFAEAIN